MRTTYALRAAMALAVLLTPVTLRAQQTGDHAAHHAAVAPATGLRAELVKDIESLEKKYVALAEATTQEQYAWRPAAGVRSVSEVFMHVAGANLMIAGAFGVKADDVAQQAASERITTKAEVLASLRHGLQHAKHAILATPDSALDTPVKLFGQEFTTRFAMVLLVSHMHEHLGQAIAYARAQGVTPPWSAGR